MTELRKFVKLESLVWDALVAGDQTADASLLADEFYGVYSAGFEDKADHCGQLKDGPTVAAYRISDARVVMLSPDIALLSYRADWSRNVVDTSCSEEIMYVSSLWRKTGGNWLNIFSQDTNGFL